MIMNNTLTIKSILVEEFMETMLNCDKCNIKMGYDIIESGDDVFTFEHVILTFETPEEAIEFKMRYL